MSEPQQERVKHVCTITVIDPDTGNPCPVDIYKLASGPLVGLDGAFLEDIGGTDEDFAWSPYDAGVKLIFDDEE